MCDRLNYDLYGNWELVGRYFFRQISGSFSLFDINFYFRDFLLPNPALFKTSLIKRGSSDGSDDTSLGPYSFSNSSSDPFYPDDTIGNDYPFCD